MPEKRRMYAEVFLRCSFSSFLSVHCVLPCLKAGGAASQASSAGLLAALSWIAIPMEKNLIKKRRALIWRGAYWHHLAIPVDVGPSRRPRAWVRRSLYLLSVASTDSDTCAAYNSGVSRLFQGKITYIHLAYSILNCQARRHLGNSSSFVVLN